MNELKCIETKYLFLFDNLLGDEDVHRRPCRHIEQEQGGDGYMMYGEYIDQGKGECDAEDSHHGFALGEAERDKLMVDVVLVGHERAFAVAHAVHHHTHHIEHGDYQEGESNDYRSGYDGFFGRVVHREADSQYAQQQADGERTGIAHEYLPSSLYLTKYIIIEEGHQYAQGGEREGGVEPPAQLGEHTSERQEGDAAQSRCQPIDAVNQVNGIEDEHDDKGGEGHGEPCGYLVESEQPVEIVEVKPGTDQDDGAGYLHHELGTVAHAYQIVHHAHEVEQEQPAEQGEHQGGEVEAERVDIEEQIVDYNAQRHGYQYTWKKCDASQTRYGCGMQLAGIDLVEEPFAERYQRDFGQDGGTHAPA